MVEPSGYRELAADPTDLGSECFPVLAHGSDDPDVTLIAYGDAVSLAEGVMAKLADEEVECEIVVPALLAPLQRKTLTNHLGKRRRIVVIEEAPAELGFSAELAAALLEGGYRGSYRRFAPPPVPIPAARSLEAAVLRSEEDIFNGVVELILEDMASAS